MSDVRAMLPLDPVAVKTANEKLWARYPALKRRQLTPDPADRHYRQRWLEEYFSAGGKAEDGSSKPFACPLEYCVASTPPIGTVPELGVFGKHDVVREIATLAKPGVVADWWAGTVKKNPQDWTGPLSVWEVGYISAMRSDSVPEPLRMRAPIDSANLTQEESEDAKHLFGTDPEAVHKYANYENRRRIVAHYIYTHPATVRMELGLYRLVRDINPIHFALERGWQVGSGKEMFTNDDVSRLGAAAEFFLALAIGIAVDRGLAAARPPGATPCPVCKGFHGPSVRPFASPEVERAFVAAVRARAASMVETLSNSERGPVLSGVLDTRTGQTFFGINQGEVPTPLHPLLRARYKAYLKATGGSTPVKAGIPGAHSEIVALNKALYAREAALGRVATESDLSEFVLHNRSLRGTTKIEGVPPPCDNCRGILPPEVEVLP